VERYLPHLTNAPLIDLSAGAWREHLGVWPAVHPQHERVKLLDQSAGTLFKFAGLGRFGSARLDRARALRGFIPGVSGLEFGFLRMQFLDGYPVHHATPDLIERMASYVACLRRRFTTRIRSDFGALVRLTGVVPDFPAFETVAVDGRMLPHEWIETSTGDFWKTDALDHYDDHFFPGCQDIAWDIAGAIVEFRMSAEQESALIEAYLREHGERYWEKRLRYHTIAYLAYRIGYAQLAQQTLGESEDAARFAELEEYYRERMALATGLFSSSIAS
jgi:hypothetical protein